MVFNKLLYSSRSFVVSLDIAYSIEIQDYIDPDRAYDLFWSGLITDKRKFLCPGSECEAKVTCANLDVDVQDMKVVPHYKTYGSHSIDCEISNGEPLSLKYEDGSPVKEEKRSIEESVVDIFSLDRPESYYDEAKVNQDSSKVIAKKSPFVRKPKDSVLRENGSIGIVYSVRSVVSRYIRYKKDGSLQHRKVNIQGKDVKYKSIFKCIWEQDLEALPNFPMIYYGWAYINRLQDESGYQIKFKKKFKKGNEDYTSTVIISDKLINGYKIKKLMVSRLEKINKKDSPTAFVFVYGKPEEKESRTGTKYANFSINNLDMIDVNHVCPMPI